AAKASGTFPLPKVDVAVHEFWAFKHGVEYAPTTPALALQLHMHNAYPKLVKLLEDVNASEAASLPRRIEKADRNKEIRRLTMKLRRMFRQTSQHHPKLDESIERIRNGNATAENSDQLEALVGLYSGNDNRYLNFYGPPGTITTIPYHKILSKTAPGAGNNLPDLTGKVVFVGYSDIYDPSQPDRFYTVFTNDDGVDLSGVEIAATAFGNLLTNRTLSHPESTTTVSIMGLFGGTVGGLTQLLPAIVSVPITLVIGGIYLYCSEWVFSQNNLWLPLAVPLLFQLPLALFSGLVAQYLSERRKQKRATRAISFYIPNKLAKEFTEKNMESSALNKVTYSICFASDMAGFTTISEQLRPKELAAFLNDYFETFSIALRNHRVDVTEFRADGIMCAWTAEKPHPEIHRHALMAALEAVEAISRFSERQPLLTQPLRIGLEAGMVYVGHSGGGGHYVYSIVGDCANTAARIEGLNKKMGTRILANRSVLEGVNGLIMRYLGDFQFVGKTEALPIVEVMAAEETATPSQQILCQRYEEAMKVFSSGRFTDAAALFEAILSEYPNDGPSRFHLSYCQNQINNPTSSENPSIIRMDSK
ncbi:MAG: adenylate/guanylate cyclase domain-containing protein, partial [Gammaproteobacteria bacterium]